MQEHYQTISQNYFEIAEYIDKRIEASNKDEVLEKLKKRKTHYLEQHIKYASLASSEQNRDN